jgi:hypothetical protein
MTLGNLMPLNKLSNQTSATIVERQSTFVRFVTRGSIEYKVSYIEKLEYLIEDLNISGVSVTDDHPILEHYRQNKIDIYISSKVKDPRAIIEEFEEMVRFEFNGWRGVSECFNPDCSLVSLLEGGYGMLYSGPEVLATKVELVLRRHDIEYKLIPHKDKQKPQDKALLMGGNIVVAKDFKIEQVQS